MLSMLEHPLFIFLLSFSTNVLVVSFTSASSPVRSACFPIVIFNVWLMLRSKKIVHYSHPMYANLLGGSVFTLALRYFDLIILRKSTYEKGGPSTTPESKRMELRFNRNNELESYKDHENTSTVREMRRRILWGISYLLDNRFSATPWEIKNVPTFSTTNHDYIPSKPIFLRNNVFRCFLSVILLDLARPTADAEKNAILFAEDKVPFFRGLGSLTTEDVAMRFITTIISTFVTYLLFQAMYSSMAVVAVGLNLSPPKRWRPLFGNVLDAWSLRRAWGKFWHQGMTCSLTGPAKYLTWSLLQLPKNSIFSRYVFTMIVFLISGSMHICGEIMAGIPFSESGVVLFFVTQVMGLLIEDTVASIWYRICGEDRYNVRGWQKAIGFVWVVLWLTWSMPAWTYPASRIARGDNILPFSIVDHIRL